VSKPESFQHRVDDSGDGCSCPIHAGRDREPFTAPLGLPFAGEVRVRPVEMNATAPPEPATEANADLRRWS